MLRDVIGQLVNCTEQLSRLIARETRLRRGSFSPHREFGPARMVRSCATLHSRVGEPRSTAAYCSDARSYEAAPDQDVRDRPKRDAWPKRYS
jgi:hypothetical protein